MKDYPVLLLVHNCLDLTKRCVESIRKQDIPTYLLVIDNGSTDGTFDWLQDNHIHTVRNEENEGVTKGWNVGFDLLFGAAIGYEYVLCPNNDTFLPSFFYREMIDYDVPFVTGFPVESMFEIGPLSARPQTGLTPYPCFSSFLLRRSIWEKVGTFNAEMKHYASDCDYHVRAHRLGIPLVKSSTPFYHEPSSTVRNASPEEQEEFHKQANKDREVFREKYGCIPGEEPAYSNLFQNLESQ